MIIQVALIEHYSKSKFFSLLTLNFVEFMNASHLQFFYSKLKIRHYNFSVLTSQSLY